MKKMLQAIAFAVSVGAACVPAQALVIGTADAANGIPFGGTTGSYYYQQIYSAASFASPLAIDTISFYNTIAPGGTTRPGTFTLYLSTTTLGVASFDTTNGVNYPWLDASFTEVFNGTLPALANGRLDIDLTTLFNYDPAQGNLVLTVKEFGLASGGGIFLDADKNNGVTNGRFLAYPYDWNQGLVTGFNDVTAPAVPEPATWAMMIGGLALVGASMRRRRVAVSFA